MVTMPDRACLSSSVIKKRILKIVKDAGISVKIKDDIVIFTKDSLSIEKKIDLILLDKNDLEDELNCQEYVDYIANHIILSFTYLN